MIIKHLLFLKRWSLYTHLDNMEPFHLLRLIVELNPVDEYGRPSKRRGLIIRNSDDLKKYRNIINADKLDKLLETMDKINSSGVKKGSIEGALEI